MEQLILDYFLALQKDFKTGLAREHAYRPALKKLIEDIDGFVIATNDAKRVKVGAPDFVVTRKNIPVGYGEAKDIGANLDETEKSEQLERYFELGNLFLTDYLEFRFFLNGGKYETIRIGKLDNGLLISDEKEFDRLAFTLKDFLSKRAITIKTAQQLVQMMAGKAKLMKEIIYKALLDEDVKNSTLHDQLNGFRKVLIHDMSESDFADIYAQTIAYGLFVARFHDKTADTFSRAEAAELVPKSNPFLRKLFSYIAGPDLDDRLKWIVDALADVFLHTDVREILKEFGKATGQNDPILHFYETFLKVYDPSLRKSRGVYYTPEPVVSFIVRSVDAILKIEFALPNGLADTAKVSIDTTQQGKKIKNEVHKVQILDPAVGTGTFLNEVIKLVRKKFEGGQQGRWPAYVDEHLLPRLHGFELLMAPYTMCHLKLGLTLAQTGYKEGNKRLGVYLTNSLEEAHEDHETLFATWLSEESNEASRVKKEMPIMVVMGNPPYSVSSANKGEWIQNLIKDYKKGLKEKKLNLDDDYIKFLRYAQYNIEKTGYGIVAMISNNSFIDGVTHRRMRECLMEAFDKIYILDLHGSAKRKEITPDGSKDENVFDIMQGVSVNIFIKTSKSAKPAEVRHFDLYGLREEKYDSLWKENIASIFWQELKPIAPYFFFVPKDFGGEEKYQKGISIPDIFPINSNGIETHKDIITIQYSKKDIENVLTDFRNLSITEIKQKYSIKKEGSEWTVKTAKEDVSDFENSIHSIVYRPFDTRFTGFTKKSKGFLARPRYEVMRHMLKNNVALLVKRQCKQDFSYSFVVDNICEACVFESSYAKNQIFPLYLHSNDVKSDLFNTTTSNRKPNLNSEIISQIARKLGLRFIEDGVGDGKITFEPENVLDYIYAVLHSPTYRKKYKEFLKIDFPRVPFTDKKEVFWQLVTLGRELRGLHLLESPKINKLITTFPISGDNMVDKIRFEGESVGKVWLNGAQYFGNVPCVAWEFWIGGYQPAQKWLKDRKKRRLSNDDIEHYQKVIVVLAETDRIMKEVDKITKEWI